MAITSILRDWSYEPSLVRMTSSDSLATIGTTGYVLDQDANIKTLNSGAWTWLESDMVLVYASDGWGFFTISADFESLDAFVFIPGVTTPTIIGHIAVYDSTGGNLGEDAATAINGGNIQAGLSGTAGYLASFPSAASKGSLRLTAVANTGDTVTTISNAAMGQASVISIPDPGASTANFLLDTGAANILTDNQEFISINDILIASVATWTKTRLAQGNYALVKTPADDTSNVSFDLTPAIRTAASKGFRLASIDVIYAIGVDDLEAHSITLDRITYANNAAVSVNSVALTGSLATAVQANPYVTNIAVTTPAFLNTADSKYVAEITVDAAATSTYAIYGLMLRFSQTIG